MDRLERQGRRQTRSVGRWAQLEDSDRRKAVAARHMKPEGGAAAEAFDSRARDADCGGPAPQDKTLSKLAPRQIASRPALGFSTSGMPRPPCSNGQPHGKIGDGSTPTASYTLRDSMKIVLCYPVEPRHVEQIAQAAPGVELVDAGQERIAREIFAADIFCGHAKVPIDWDGVVRAGRLKWIQSSAAGWTIAWSTASSPRRSRSPAPRACWQTR